MVENGNILCYNQKQEMLFPNIGEGAKRLFKNYSGLAGTEFYPKSDGARAVSFT